MDKKYCDRCGKCLTDENGITDAGVRISFQSSEQAGKYEVDREYRTCPECLLDALLRKDGC